MNKMNKNVLGATFAAALSIAAIVPAVAETTTAEAAVKRVGNCRQKVRCHA
ncbi:hypothetical protein [Burkholderia cepacia]|uniref:hypothetical protein n=1 Tax=Burkholderia cepacia TaxID=292 RepID=UPI002ABE0058|nr:hypothetical protein [Burkholderia cepacia]